MQKRFEGRLAMVTGVGSGIGRASALRLGQEGAHIFGCDIDTNGLADFETEAKGAGIRVDTHVLDVADAGACRAAVAQAVEAGGKLDVLCNIAGISKLDHLGNFSDEQWSQMLATNLSSVFFLSQAAMPHLTLTKGCIVNLASTAGLEGQAYNAPYCATKAGVVMLSKSMALEFAAAGVRVNALCPGGVNTALLRATKMPEGADPRLFARLMPFFPLAEADEIATAVAYLASEDARYVTGVAFPIDGGQTI